MPQIINTNIASLNAQRNLDKSQSDNQTALQRLSSGLRINSAKDDAAGLAISTRFTSQIKGLNVAVRNAGDGIALAQTAEGALGTINENLQRIRELAVQSSNATNSDVDREALQAEVDQLVAEITRTSEETDFNGRNLLDGSFSATFQIGANAGQTVDISIAELTADKLGSSSTAGVSAQGTSSALQNGDLIINGEAITASKAEDDTASTSNASSSAISKVAAINRHSDDTGVTAQVNENVVSGSEMTGAAGTATLTLNGVEIDLSTSTSTDQTRAGVAEAINAVADQTGIKAINTDTDAGGIQLVAEDGRNIQVSFSALTGDLTTANVSAATGLADGGQTYTGGYTLVANSSVGEIEVSGGNGTGNGDLANSGLVAGTYERGVASSVSSETSSTLGAQTVTSGTNYSNKLAAQNDNATLFTGGDKTNTLVTSDAAASTTTNYLTASITVTNGITGSEGAPTQVTFASDSALYDIASGLSDQPGVDAFERISFIVQDYDSAGTGSIFLGGAEIALNDDTLTDYDTEEERLVALTEAINTASYDAGLTVTAELSDDKTEVLVTIDNRSGDAVKFGATSGDTVTYTKATGSAMGPYVAVETEASATSTFVGQLAFTTSGNTKAVEISFTEATAGVAASDDLFDGKSVSAKDYGTSVLSSTADTEINVSIDGTAQSSVTVDSGSTVNDLVSALNTNYSDINAYEETTLTFSATNLEIGDTLYFGTSADVTGDVGVAIADVDGSGGAVTLADIADSINDTDFSAQNIDVSATLDSSSNLVVTVKNYSGSQVGAVTDASGRSLTQSGGDILGSVQQQLSGNLKYSSESGKQVDVTLSTSSTDELFASASSNTSFAGVNGLENGDVLINGVTIGAADTAADTASAEYASDGTKILSSSKEQSGIAIAAAINEVSGETGVTATVNATEVVGGDGTNATANLSEFAVGDEAEIYINGYSAGTVTLQDDGNGAIDTDRAKADALSIINSISGKTGVSGEDNGISLTLSAEDGRNMSIAIDDKSGANASIGALFGLDAAVDGIGEATFGKAAADSNTGVSSESLTYETTYSTIRLDSAGAFEVKAGNRGADELSALGLSEGSFGGAEDGVFLKDIDISTYEGAQAAITSIDNAISQVATQRADLGAIQNRLESTVSSLQVTSENLNSANSRIRDADFAAETAELSRTQVLQQAGISILAQANAAGQQVLSLLG